MSERSFMTFNSNLPGSRPEEVSLSSGNWLDVAHQEHVAEQMHEAGLDQPEEDMPSPEVLAERMGHTGKLIVVYRRTEMGRGLDDPFESIAA